MTALKSSSVDTARLRSFYKGTPTARLIFDHFAERQRNRKKTTVDHLERLLVNEGHDVDRTDVIEFFRELESIGCGDFLVGRRGHPSRFEWSVEMTDVGRAAAGKIDRISPISPDAEYDDESGENLEHSFRLRPDFEVTIELPADLTTTEARRLADFIRTLPFGDSD